METIPYVLEDLHGYPTLEPAYAYEQERITSKLEPWEIKAILSVVGEDVSLLGDPALDCFALIPREYRGLALELVSELGCFFAPCE